jgi:hypothetical protein
MRLTILRTVILINAVATLAAGVVLFVFPGAIPSVVGIVLAPDLAGARPSESWVRLAHRT